MNKISILVVFFFAFSLFAGKGVKRDREEFPSAAAASAAEPEELGEKLVDEEELGQDGKPWLKRRKIAARRSPTSRGSASSESSMASSASMGSLDSGDSLREPDSTPDLDRGGSLLGGDGSFQAITPPHRPVDSQESARMFLNGGCSPRTFLNGLNCTDTFVKHLLQRMAADICEGRCNSAAGHRITPGEEAYGEAPATPMAAHDAPPFRTADLPSSGSSKKSRNVIYYISIQQPGVFPDKIDLENRPITERELVERMKRAEPKGQEQRPKTPLDAFFKYMLKYNVVYYIGQTIQELQDRKSGHASSVNTEPEKRISGFLREQGPFSVMRTMIENIPDDEGDNEGLIDAIESFLIRRYGANKHGNLNSNPGSSAPAGAGAAYFYSDPYVSPSPLE